MYTQTSPTKEQILSYWSVTWSPQLPPEASRIPQTQAWDMIKVAPVGKTRKGMSMINVRYTKYLQCKMDITHGNECFNLFKDVDFFCKLKANQRASLQIQTQK